MSTFHSASAACAPRPASPKQSDTPKPTATTQRAGRVGTLLQGGQR